MADPNTHFIFEAAFDFKGYAARADILQRKPDGWSVIEVKSSLHDETEASDEHIADLAYTTQVIIHSGVKVTSAELMRLSRDRRLGHDTAVAKFAQIARGECSQDECHTIRADLLKYCGQDTLAMVKLHNALFHLATN